MSLVVPTFTGGNMLATTGISSAATGTAAATGRPATAGGSTTALPFAQTLVQSMGTAAKSTETPLLANLASLLQGLLNTAQSTGEESGQALDGKNTENSETAASPELLEGLMQDIEKLDDTVSDDPALLAALQGWLHQVSLLLSGNSNTVETGEQNMDADAVTGLSPLAHNSETVRFVVQDDLNSLISLIQQTSVAGNEEIAAEGIELLNKFSAIMAKAAVPESKPKTTAVIHSDTSAVESNTLAAHANLTDSSVSGNHAPAADTANLSDIPAVASKQQSAAENNTLAAHATRTDSSVSGNHAAAADAANLSDIPAVTTKQQSAAENTKPVFQFEAKALPQTPVRAADAAAAKAEANSPLKTVLNAEMASTEAAATPFAKTSAEVKPTGTTEETLPEIKGTSEENNVITAGQLSLRGGITAPLKAVTVQVPVHHFAQEMNTMITGKLEILKKGGVAEATITLFPENLGQVDVKITMQNGNLIAQFLTEHSGAKDMLEQQMNQLRSALQAQGLQVERLEVAQNSALLSQYNGQQGRQTASGGQQQGGRSKERREEIADAVLAAELNGEWKDWVENGQHDGRNEGRGFSAKA